MALSRVGPLRSREGRADIELEFEPGWDMQRALADVQTAVDGVTTLPEEAIGVIGPANVLVYDTTLRGTKD